jgi:DNA (cytosine-5)-methyltransferase 1
MSDANANVDGVEYVVRRITPVEAERLQGFEDGYTDLTGCDVDAVTDAVAASLGYGEEEKATLRKRVSKWSRSCPDSHRFKAIGNSMATNVMRWIGWRLQVVDDLDLSGSFSLGDEIG